MSNLNDIQKSKRTVYPSRQVLHLWGNDCPRDLRGGNVSTRIDERGYKLFSYSAAIAYTYKEKFTPQGFRIVLMRDPFYSKTTGKHIGQAWSAIPNRVRLELNKPWDGSEESLNDFSFENGDNPFYKRFVFCGVTCIGETIDGSKGHLDNYSTLFNKGLEQLEKLKTAKKNGFPGSIAEIFIKAEIYRQTFLPKTEPLKLPKNSKDIVSAFIQRKEKAEKREEDKMKIFEGQIKDWMSAMEPFANEIKKYLNEEKNKEKDMHERILEWESHLISEEESAYAIVDSYCFARRLVNSALNGSLFNKRDEALSLYPNIKRFIDKLPMRWMGSFPVLSRGKQKLIYGKEISFWDKCGLCPYPTNYIKLSQKADRNLVRISKSGEEIETSDGARLPLSLSLLLFKKYRDQIENGIDAKEIPSSPTFSEPIQLGHFSWTGWTKASLEAIESGSCKFLMRIGCHKVCPKNLVRILSK